MTSLKILIDFFAQERFLPKKSELQQGQSFVEFMMLLLMLIILSYTLMAVVNNNLADKWQKAVDQIVNFGLPGSDQVEIKLR